MTMRTDTGRSLAKRLHTALVDRKPTRKEKWTCNTLKKLGHNHGGPTAAVGARRRGRLTSPPGSATLHPGIGKRARGDPAPGAAAQLGRKTACMNSQSH